MNLTAGGAVATQYSFRADRMEDWGKSEGKERKTEKQTSVIAFKQNKMILPSILSEASSLVAKRENKGEGRNKGKRLT